MIPDPAQNPLDEFRLFATEPMSMSICVAYVICGSVHYKAKDAM